MKHQPLDLKDGRECGKCEKGEGQETYEVEPGQATNVTLLPNILSTKYPWLQSLRLLAVFVC